jgi:DNA-binding transcriptional LysR family regulator
MPLVQLDQLRFHDMVTFLAVSRSGSITGAARSLQVTPSQVSKAIKRLEKQLGTQLLSRGARGVTLSVAAERVRPKLEDIVRWVGGLRGTDLMVELTVAAPSFLNALFLPRIAMALPGHRIRGLELPPALVRAYAAENFFDLALTIGLERFPETWENSSLGTITKGLFATPAVARRLGSRPISSDKLANLPFIVPIYHHNGRFVLADEGCPLAGDRRLGHEVQTIALGLELAARTGQLVFSPKILARSYVARGELVEIVVKSWDVREELYVACNGERVLANVRNAIVSGLRAQLEALTKGE